MEKGRGGVKVIENVCDDIERERGRKRKFIYILMGGEREGIRDLIVYCLAYTGREF